MYTLNSTLGGHVASINALAFSPDGKYLASGADDGFIFIWEVNGGREAHKLDGKSPVTALMWSRELYAGFADGRVASAEVTPDDLTAGYIPRNDGGVVEYISADHSAQRLAICVGPEVEIWTRIRNYKMGRKVLPSPSKASRRLESHRSTVRVSNAASEHEQADDRSQCLKPRSALFLKSENSLLVGYLEDGIYCWECQTQAYVWHISTRVGRLSLTPDERFLAVSNLYDGFDLYRISDHSWVRAFGADTRLNVPLPVIVVEDGGRLLTGSSCGQVSLFDLHTGNEIQKLCHDDDVIQALAFHSYSTGTCLLATGASEGGPNSLVRIWRSPPSTRRVDVAVETEPSGAIIRSCRPMTAASPIRPNGKVALISIMGLACLSVIIFQLTRPGQSYDSLQIVGSYKSNVAQEVAGFAYGFVVNICVSAARSMITLLNRYIEYLEGTR